MKKGKIKEFLEDHKEEIIAGACVIGVTVVSGLFGFWAGRNYFEENEYRVDNRAIKNVFATIPNGTLVNTFGAVLTNPLHTEELGALGEFMAENGVPEDNTFTHFVAIGKAET
jgi:hypothetical protein